MSIANTISTQLSTVALEDSSASKVYISPEIPEKILNNSIHAMKVQEDPEDILGILDTTLFHKVDCKINPNAVRTKKISFL